jgi:hypothetical protein
MSNLTNSIVRGFGMTVGRRAANSMLDSAQQPSSPVRYSNFTIWSGTILLGGFLGCIIGIFGIALMGTFGFVLSVLLGMFLMNRWYVSSNKKYDKMLVVRNEQLAKIDSIVDDIEQQYIGNKITKREYQILMKDAQKLYDKV